MIEKHLSDSYKQYQNNRNTANVKRDQDGNIIAYDNAIFINEVKISGNAAGNYELSNTTINGDIKVTPADLNITLNDVERIYGNTNLVNSSYGINKVEGLVNGDDNTKDSLIINVVSDGAIDNVTNPQKTNDVTADGYIWSGTFSGIDNINNNYNITVAGGKSTVKAKTITINDLLGTIVYGNQGNKGLHIDTNASLIDGSIAYSDDVTLVTDGANYTTGGLYDANRNNRVTADVGIYSDSLYVNGLKLTGDKAGNYILDTSKAVGSIEVTKAKLDININNVNITYGQAESSISPQYGFSASTETGKNLVNGDGLNDVIISMDYNNTAYNQDGTTQDVKGSPYKLNASNVSTGSKSSNYDITYVSGDVTMEKATISIGANDVQINLGQTPNYTGTDINGVLVNGDSFDTGYHYGVADSAIEDIVGTYNNAIGIWIGNNFYDLAQASNWTGSGIDTFFSNYDINFTPGTLTVGDKVEPDYNWSYLYNDNPFDRIKNFRERKAEVNFVAGGMEI